MRQHSDTRIALVTGAARGIGRAVVRRLLVEGWTVWCLDHDGNALDAMRAALADDAHARTRSLTADVGNEADVEQALARIAGIEGRLDLLVNNAGIADPVTGPVEALALADWQRLIDTNLTGCFLLAKHATPLLRIASGCIVNMASSRALQSEPHTEAYAASKGGIQALTHALAVSLGPRIRVNAIAPGWIDVRGEQPNPAEPPAPLRAIDRDQHPVGRVGTGDDVAGAVVYLASRDAAFVTGQTLVVDGGMTRRMIYAH